ncbi:DMT family transporter [Ramlibacter sp. GTP1]|uniref:DMT family transporter n=2 Tax=Ramlibacter albus TaxID=2079448 RepID=A0A923S0F3_9BURK|nr:DMT family transporter [Ramlibacter albus]
MHRRASRLDPTVRGLLWSSAAGLLFVLLNTLMRGLAIDLDPFEVQFLRYVFGIVVLLPMVAHSGVAAYMPLNIRGQFVRGGVHTLGLCLWFVAIPHITIADTTAIGFTGPIFIMLGAALVFKEPMRWERWLAAAIGFAGVLIVVGPKLSAAGGIYTLVMLASSPVFAASFLLTKALTRYERAEVIVLWQGISVALLSLPLSLLHWQWPTAWQWGGFFVCGFLGSAGHYCLTRSYAVADISATQSVKFLDLVWASALGWLVFSDMPSDSTLLGGFVIFLSTMWIARREARSRVA